MTKESIIELIKSQRDAWHKEGTFKYDDIYNDLLEAIEPDDQAKLEPKEECDHKRSYHASRKPICLICGVESRFIPEPKEKKKPIERLPYLHMEKGEDIEGNSGIISDIGDEKINELVDRFNDHLSLTQ